MTVDAPSLLITDDDCDFREALREVFEPRGFHTILAGDGEEALRIVQREPVHLILLDMHMPRLTGLETIRRVKEMRSLLPCILISAQLDDAITRAAEEAHAYRVLTKLSGIRKIIDVVKQALAETYQWRVG
ncbi:MAG TPA: response regulator [Pirellulaceae bacterium]|nr:response regulator [Pirellulaceae bacterium]